MPDALRWIRCAANAGRFGLALQADHGTRSDADQGANATVS
jgi:hypothetical protein